MTEVNQKKSTTKHETTIARLSPVEVEIYQYFKLKGFAVAHIDEHRNLWEWSLENKCGVYIGRRHTPTDPSAGNKPNKWANPYILNSRIPGDGKRDKVILSFYQHISNKFSLHEKLEKQLKGKILFCHCRKNVRNRKTNRCHGDILAALANESLSFLDTSVSTGATEMQDFYKDSDSKQIELNL